MAFKRLRFTKVKFPGKPRRSNVAVLSYSPNVTLALSGISSTGSVGTLTTSRARDLTGVFSTTAIDTLAPSITKALTGLLATGAVDTMTVASDVAVTGVSLTGSVGTVVPLSFNAAFVVSNVTIQPGFSHA